MGSGKAGTRGRMVSFDSKEPYIGGPYMGGVNKKKAQGGKDSGGRSDPRETYQRLVCRHLVGRSVGGGKSAGWLRGNITLCRHEKWWPPLLKFWPEY